MVRIGIVIVLLFLMIAVRLLSMGIERSEAAVLKDAYIDDGCKLGLSADGLFFLALPLRPAR